MGKCLITTLKEAVSDSSLLKLGELRFSISSVDSPTVGGQTLGIDTNASVTMSIEGDGYFTDSTLTANYGKTLLLVSGTNMVYFSNGNYKVSILNKYAVIRISTTATTSSHMHFNFGDISALSGMTNLVYLYLNNITCSGDISVLRDTINLTALNLNNTTCSGDISSLKYMTNLTILNLNNTACFGDISALKDMTKLNILSLNNTTCTGDISALSGMTNLSEFSFKYLNLFGDLSTINAKFITNQYGSSKFTWSTTRASSKNITAMENVYLGSYVDAMLVNLANCTASFAGTDAWYKTIRVIGTQTSTSTSAISTLTSKGYTISVTSS